MANVIRSLTLTNPITPERPTRGAASTTLGSCVAPSEQPPFRLGTNLCPTHFDRPTLCSSLPCSKSHLPGFIDKADELKAKGVDAIACVSVNDAFVMSAWGQQLGAGDKVMMLADGAAEFAKVGA
jgi:Redoxin